MVYSNRCYHCFCIRCTKLIGGREDGSRSFIRKCGFPHAPEAAAKNIQICHLLKQSVKQSYKIQHITDT